MHMQLYIFDLLAAKTNKEIFNLEMIFIISLE